MPIIVNKRKLVAETFSNEFELRDILFEHPNLLQINDEENYYSLAKEVKLPNSGTVDLLLIEENGTLILVETKLNRNGEIRRKVVGQVFDYFSDLSSLGFEEVDDLLQGALSSICTEIEQKKKITNNSLKKNIHSIIKSGNIRVTIVIDEINSDLQRIMEFLNSRTDLDICLFQIQKFDEGKILIPNCLVSGNDRKVVRNTSIIHRDPIFGSLIDSYNKEVKEALKTQKDRSNYSYICLEDWPNNIHYEFSHKKREKSVGIEFHIESLKFLFLQSIIKEFDGEQINQYTIKYDGKWSKGCGKIFFNIPLDEKQTEIIKNMLDFISHTKEKINESIKNNRE